MKTYFALHGAAVAFSLWSGPASASCDNADTLLRHAYPEAAVTSTGFEVKGDYVRRISPNAVACKVWPANPALTLIAVPLLEADPAQSGEVRGDVEIIVADSVTGRPLGRRLEKDMAFSDAYQFGDVGLDTARYDIGNGVRAFGLRTRQEASSRVYPTWEHALWLYTFRGGRIDRVLDGLIVEHSHGENDGDCEGTSADVKRTVSMGGLGPAGYRDLLVDQTETDEVTKKTDDDCKATDSPGASKHFVLHFVEGRYQPPPGMGADPDDPSHDLMSLIMTP